MKLIDIAKMVILVHKPKNFVEFVTAMARTAPLRQDPKGLKEAWAQLS